jgi:YVTN family beta-propeller protein
MRARTWFAALISSALLAACGGGSGSHKHKAAPARATTVASVEPTALPPAPRRVRPASLAPDRAFVTAETENRLLVVALPSGRVVRRIALPRDPEDLATEGVGGTVVVVSAAAGKVTLLDGNSLRALKVIGGFVSPHIAAIAPDGDHAYITDDARGTVTVIDLANLRVTSTIHVGAGAHHLCFDITNHMAWVALGESARNIVLVGTQDLARPRVTAQIPPRFRVHDLACSPDSRRVWLTSASGPDVTLVDGFDQRAVFRVPVGAPPQHVALTGLYAYLTSGYGSTIEQVDARNGRILHHARTPYGSFELAADGRYVVVSSLLHGTLAIFTPQLKLLRVVRLAPATREVALSSPAGSPP